MEAPKFDKEAFKKVCADANIDLTKNFVSLNFLPTSGVFESYRPVSVGTDFAHIEVLTSGGGHIALNALSAQMNDSNDREGIVKYENDKDGVFYNLATVAHNPSLTGHPEHILEMIIGKSFTTKEIHGFAGKFVKGGCKTKEEVAIVPKTMYKIEIKG